MITIVVDDGSIVKAISVLQGRMTNATPAMRAVAQVVRSDIVERFELQNSPDGVPWKPLTMATIISRARRHAPSGFKKRRGETIARFAGGAKALLDTGALRNSIKIVRADRSEAVVGTRLRYAAIHHFGGKAGRGKRVTIPSRPFMGLSDGARRDIINIVAQYLSKGGQ